MIGEGYFRRHVERGGGNREIALLDVAQEYVLEFLRREGLFDGHLVFKGGTALRKFVFGPDGRFSTDLDFGLTTEDDALAEFVLDLLDGASFRGVEVKLERRAKTAAVLRIMTPLGSVTEPAAISIRTQVPWLPVIYRKPVSFEFLDRGLASDFVRMPLPILDPREIVAEKIAAFWRRRKARDLYDLEHLGSVLQTNFDGPSVAALTALKIYFDAIDEKLYALPMTPDDILGCSPSLIVGRGDLGTLRASSTDADELLLRCSQRYSALVELEPAIRELLTEGTRRHRFRATELRDRLVERLRAESRDLRRQGNI